ncbi:MAG: T9SS type A sorting domain-containing protein [Bacteroidota bacterium]|nr:T9SS type A sorting domain-containing protein [Bacteroidota bacterium]
MKKLFTKHISVLRLLAVSGCAAGCSLVPNVLHAQTYYSQFPIPKDGYNYKTYSPAMGESCMATPIQNSVGVADAYGTNDQDITYAFFTAIGLTMPYNCDTTGTGRYKFNVNLNLPANVPSLAAGSDVGFRIRIPTGISKDSLGKYIVIGTYLLDADRNATFQEYRTGDSLKGKGLDQSADGKTWIIHFTTLKPMNDLELSVDPKITQLNTIFEFDVFYGYGSVDVTLPAQIANFKAAVSGKNVNLSWQSLTETNVKGYRIERSSNGGTTYTPVALVVAKGNNNAAINYAYNDNGVTDGNYLYRLVILDKSGTFKNSSSVAANISGQGQLLLYPTVIKAGQTITVKTSETGDVTVHVFDGTGRLVKQQRINSNGQFNIATSGLTTGIYTVKIVSASGNVSQSRIMVN